MTDEVKYLAEHIEQTRLLIGHLTEIMEHLAAIGAARQAALAREQLEIFETSLAVGQHCLNLMQSATHLQREARRSAQTSISWFVEQKTPVTEGLIGTPRRG